MDYDDNDFQSQNFQLIGEDDTFLPSLRPFALPKFDIDDQLQVHLRLDNVIEKEVLFEIQDQRHNWIEDFTPGSSAVEFSSSVAESCSISRTNNVWSEATSSESVEMLLKSVGDDEMAHNRDETKHGDAHDELNGRDCQIDPLLGQDKSNSSTNVDIKNPRALQHPCHTCLSGLKEDAIMSHSRFEIISHCCNDAKHDLVLENMLKQKISSEMESVVEEHSVNDNAASSSNDTSKNHLTVDDYLEEVHNENLLESSSKSKIDCDNNTCYATEGRIACSKFVICEGKKDVPSAISIDIGVDSGNLNNDLFSQHMAELPKIHMGHSYDLQPVNQQEGKSHVVSVDIQLNQIAERCVVDTESSDGLLEAITCQVKTLSRGTDTGICRKEVSSLEQEGVSNIMTHTVEESKEDAFELSRSEHFDYSSHCQNENRSKKTNSELENLLLFRRSELTESGEKELSYIREDSKENQDPQGHSSSNSNDCATDSSKLISVEHCNPEKHGIEAEEQVTDPMNFTFQNTEKAALPKCAEDEDAKDTTSTPEASEDVVSKEFSSLPDETEFISLIGNRKTIDMAGGCNLVNRLSNHQSVPQVSASVEEKAAPSASSLGSISFADSNIVKDKLECKGQSTDQLTCLDNLSASNLVQGKLGVDHATKGARSSSFESFTASQNHYEDIPSMSVAVGHEEVAASHLSASNLSASGLIDSCFENVETPGESSLADLKNKKAVQSSDDALNCDANNLGQSISSGSSEKSHQDPICGSPTIISSTDCCQNEPEEGSKVLPDHLGAASDGIVEGHTTHTDKTKLTVQGFEKESSTSEDDKSFSFKVASLEDLSGRDSGIDWKPFPSTKASDITVASKESAEEHHMDPKDGNFSGATSEDVGKQISCHATEKVSSAIGAATEVLQKKRTETDRGAAAALPGDDIITTTSNIQLDQIQQPACPSAVETTSLPDLNASICAATSIRQSFSDPQHVQLRAQIFVYGSLIQGVPPGEAFMISAFGNSDGGRTAWESAWHAAVERFQNQKSPWSNCCRDTPVKNISNLHVGQTGSKFLQSPWGAASRGTLTPSIPRGTQLEFIQVMPPLYSYQSSQLRRSTSSAATWFTQTPHPAAWPVSPLRPTYDVGTPSPVAATSEAAKVMPPRDSSTYNASNVQLALPSTLLPGRGSPSVSAALVMQDEAHKTADSTNKNATDTQKQRKRRKSSGGQEQGSLIHATQCKTKPPSPTLSTKNSPISSSFTLTASSPDKIAFSELTSDTCQIKPPSNYHIIGGGGTESRVIFSEEMCSKIEQSKLQAADAAAHAGGAIKYSQGIWSQLAEQKKSGLLSEVEERLASAAVTVAAAASVAKAAAEAAKVASEAALQAKQMADEAISSGKVVGLSPVSETSQFGMQNNLARLTPVSVLNGKDRTHGPCGAISVAREVARKRVESSAAATKRAKNLDTILKAAELAAEAVAQAGAVIAMGDPLPVSINELLDAGPDGYWKARCSKIGKPSINSLSNTAVAGDCERSPTHVDQHSTDSEVQKSIKASSIPNKQFVHLEGIQSIQTAESENDTGDVTTITPIDKLGDDPSSSGIEGSSIQKGSLVEVVADDAALRGIWFSARVLDIKDNKAYICYDSHPSSEGSGHHKEWIPLECEADKAPRLRVAHPITTVNLEGTRKRRREAIGSFFWAIGDHVDAWIRDGWWEGIVAGKTEGDETTVSVHFPARGSTSVVKAWNLRPSLFWKDAQWIQWSRAHETDGQSYQSDSPYKKRQRLGHPGSTTNPGNDGQGAAGLTEDTNVNISGKSEELKSLNLSLREQSFNIGKNVIEDNNNAHVLDVKRTGLQKGGPRAVFGVPRPGKKRKFMEVSRRYDAGKLDTPTEGGASVKIAKYLMPRTFRAGGTSSRAHKSPRAQKNKGRSTNEKEFSSTIVAPASNSGDSNHGSLTDLRASVRSEDSILQMNAPYAVPLTNNNRTVDDLLSKFHALHGKNDTETNIGARGKLATVVNESARNERVASDNLGKTTPDAGEPRRSHRRIQPTSRLLEGLQSSLIMPKTSSDKSARGPQRGASSSRGRARG